MVLRPERRRLTIESVSPGRHTITFVTTSGSVRKTVRVEAGENGIARCARVLGVDCRIRPVLLEIAENGRSIGTSEQGRLIAHTRPAPAHFQQP